MVATADSEPCMINDCVLMSMEHSPLPFVSHLTTTFLTSASQCEPQHSPSHFFFCICFLFLLSPLLFHLSSYPSFHPSFCPPPSPSFFISFLLFFFLPISLSCWSRIDSIHCKAVHKLILPVKYMLSESLHLTSPYSVSFFLYLKSLCLSSHYGSTVR